MTLEPRCVHPASTGETRQTSSRRPAAASSMPSKRCSPCAIKSAAWLWRRLWNVHGSPADCRPAGSHVRCRRLTVHIGPTLGCRKYDPRVVVVGRGRGCCRFALLGSDGRGLTRSRIGIQETQETRWECPQADQRRLSITVAITSYSGEASKRHPVTSPLIIPHPRWRRPNPSSELGASEDGRGGTAWRI